MSSLSPLRMRESGPEYDSEHDAVVCVLSDFCDSVTDNEEFVGRFNAVSRFPQYLCYSQSDPSSAARVGGR